MKNVEFHVISTYFIELCAKKVNLRKDYFVADFFQSFGPLIDK